jgi:ubiquinone/menaquinone biosynthesis C-methylase UbiE
MVARASSSSSRRLTKFYGEMSSSIERVTQALAAEGVDLAQLTARDLYTRSLDCQNLGSYAMLEVLASAACEYGKLGAPDRVLDVGCGLGGPGRFLAGRFGCAVVGIDLVPLRTEIARALSERTGLGGRIEYRVADATALPFEDGSFGGAWMLDVSMHIRDKRALFGEIARVLQPGGLLVMHEQTAPIPSAMRAVTRRAPYIAPSLPQLLRYVDDAGLRVLTWRDTTPRVLEYFEQMKARPQPVAASPSPSGDAGREWWRAVVDGYIETLAHLGGRTGILVAKRVGPGASHARA